MANNDRQPTSPSPPLLRRLETRRVLDASIASLLLPDTGVEGETIVASEAVNPVQPFLTFDWTITQDGMPVAQSTSPTFDFTPTDDGLYDVSLTLNGIDSTATTTQISVSNANPTLSNVTLTSTVEGGTATLSGNISDPGIDDSFTLDVDWGDGTTDTYNFAAGTTEFSETHQYLDDNPSATATDFPEVMLTLTDDDGGFDELAINGLVQNVSPQILNLAATDADENGFTTLTGEIVDPGTQDTFLLSVDWGDGTFDEYLYAAGTTDFSETHQYLDDSPTGPPTITALVVDDDNGNDLAFVSPVISNVAPELQDLGATDTNENGSTTLTGTIVDPGTEDTFTVMVDWGDGTTDTYNYAAGTTEFSETHQYLDDDPTATPIDTPTITVKVMDDDLGSDEKQTTLRVLNVSPQINNLSVTNANENGSVTLAGEILDPGTQDSFLLTVDWGDGTFDQYMYAAGTTTFSETHQYLDDNPTGTSVDTPTITVLLTDDDNGNDLEFILPTITNVAPQIENLAATNTNENGFTTLSGQIIDPGTQDTFTLTVDWGDGTSDVFNYAAGTTDFSETHQYLDDNPTATPIDSPTITVTLTDDDLGSDEEQVSPLVLNVAPQITDLAATDTNENGFTTLTGNIVDPGTQDTFLLSVDWGDGTFDEYVYAAGTTEFSETHQYLDDNPPGTPSDTPTITVLLVDDDNGNDLEFVAPTVSNVAPELQDLAAADINENGTTTLTGKVVDPGTQDTFVLTVDWGDGTIEQFSYAAGTTEFSETHQYLDDNPTGTAVDTPTITVSIADDDLGADSESVQFALSNLPPVIGNTPDLAVDEGERFELADMMIEGIGFTDAGTLDTHSATIDWGDGTPVESLTVTFVDGVGRLNGGHTYADNGNYTAKIILVDDDLGIAEQSFSVNVSNVNPILTGTDSLSVDEGEGFTLAGLGVGVSDPGYDNPLNTIDATNGGETEELFLDGTIDWGDGTATAPVTFISRVSGSEGVATIAVPDHAEHHYADNGVFTVKVSFADDDGAIVTREFDLTVLNVAPSLELNDPNAVINEGDTLELPMLGSFTDPGFDNPLDPAGATTETFSYTIDWGDGTIEIGQLPSAVVQGSAGVLTTGDLAAEHLYADNDVDNLYTISVTLSDDDGGMVTKSFEVTVLNVAPTLDPIAATDLEGAGITTLDLTFSDPGADTFEVLVDWGDKPDLAPEDRFVVEVLHAGSTPQSFSIDHQYTGPPDPMNPSADIIITVKIRDDDFATATTLVVGESNLETVAISNPGIEDNKVAIDTTPQAPAIEFPEAPELFLAAEIIDSDQGNNSLGEVGAAAADQSAVSDRYLEIRIVSPDGTESEGIRLEESALDDLPGLFSRLPDNRYRIYLIQEETNSERLVIDVNARGGRLIDPSDDSDGGRDRPPTAEEPVDDFSRVELPKVTLPSSVSGIDEMQNNQSLDNADDSQKFVVDRTIESEREFVDSEVSHLASHPVKAFEAESTEAFEPPNIDADSTPPIAMAAIALAGSHGAWRRQVEEALTNADQGRWQRLFRRRRD